MQNWSKLEQIQIDMIHKVSQSMREEDAAFGALQERHMKFMRESYEKRDELVRQARNMKGLLVREISDAMGVSRTHSSVRDAVTRATNRIEKREARVR